MAGNFITLASAVSVTTTYRANRESILKTEFTGKNLLPLCDTFDKGFFETLVNKPECVKIRIYYGMDSSLKMKPIIVAVDAGNHDILPPSDNDPNEDIVDDGGRCPTDCPPSSPLNE